jgi:flagellar basal body P-ring protein FlgI
MASMLEKMGVTVDQKDIQVKNVAAVMVTASLPPFAKRGNRIDVLVSSIGDANNLQGGTLMLTPLKGVTVDLCRGPGTGEYRRIRCRRRRIHRGQEFSDRR